jgi:hypothetical protein
LQKKKGSGRRRNKKGRCLFRRNKKERKKADKKGEKGVFCEMEARKNINNLL